MNLLIKPIILRSHLDELRGNEEFHTIISSFDGKTTSGSWVFLFLRLCQKE